MCFLQERKKKKKNGVPEEKKGHRGPSKVTQRPRNENIMLHVRSIDKDQINRPGLLTE